MELWQNILEALESLTSNKMRSGLTILGIVIGVGAVIAMLAIGSGAENTITGSISELGTNLIFIVDGGDEEVRNPQPLTLDDSEAIGDSLVVPAVEAVAPILSGGAEASYSGQSHRTSISGVTPDYQAVRNVGLSEGEFISEVHMLGLAAVAVIGPDTAEELFGHSEGVVGEVIRISGQPFRIIGVKEAIGGSGFQNPDDEILIPLSTAQTRLLRRPMDEVDMIIAQAVDADSVSQANQEIAALLRARHRTPIGLDDFTIFTQQDFIDTAQTITGVLTIFLGGIAGISRISPRVVLLTTYTCFCVIISPNSARLFPREPWLMAPTG